MKFCIKIVYIDINMCFITYISTNVSLTNKQARMCVIIGSNITIVTFLTKYKSAFDFKSENYIRIVIQFLKKSLFKWITREPIIEDKWSSITPFEPFAVSPRVCTDPEC